jgi:hypothetical protein
MLCPAGLDGFPVILYVLFSGKGISSFIASEHNTMINILYFGIRTIRLYINVN